MQGTFQAGKHKYSLDSRIMANLVHGAESTICMAFVVICSENVLRHVRLFFPYFVLVLQAVQAAEPCFSGLSTLWLAFQNWMGSWRHGKAGCSGWIGETPGFRPGRCGWFFRKPLLEDILGCRLKSFWAGGAQKFEQVADVVGGNGHSVCAPSSGGRHP